MMNDDDEGDDEVDDSAIMGFTHHGLMGSCRR
jgi:hypothetical protein